MRNRFTAMKKTLCILVTLFVAVNVLAQKVYDKRPTSYNYKRAVEEVKKQNYKTAMGYLDAELNANPKNGWAYGRKGYISAQVYDNGIALDNLGRSLKLLPKKDTEYVAWVYKTRADVYLNVGDTVAAIRDLESAMNCRPEDVSNIMAHCDIYFKRKDIAVCEADVEKMYKVAPNNTVVYVYDGRNKFYQKQYDAAIALFTQAIKLADEYAKTYSLRAEAYMQKEMYAEAAQDVVKSLSIDLDEYVFSVLDTLAEKSFNNINVRLLAQRNEEPNNPFWTYCLGEINKAAEKYCEALAYFKELVKTNDFPALANRQIAQIYLDILQPAAGIAYLNQDIETDSVDEKSLQLRADCYEEMGKYQEAVDDINQLIERHPDYDYLYGRRASLRRKIGLLKNAIDDYSMAVDLNHDEPYYLVERGRTYVMLHKENEAKADLKKALKMYEGADYDDEYYNSYRATCYGWLYKVDNTDTESRTKLLRISHDYLERAGADSGDMYDAACAHALAGESKDALLWLEKAFANGYMDIEHVETDFDLESVRSMEDYKKIVREARENIFSKYDCVDLEANDTYEYEEKTVEVPFMRENGVYKVKCSINGLPLNFYFDTGASSVTMSNVEAAFMMKNGYLNSKDVVGSEYYTTANGDISEGTVVNLRSVEFAGLKLEGVKASIVHSQNAPLLLGQSVLRRLGKIEIDYSRNVLIITKRVRK